MSTRKRKASTAGFKLVPTTRARKFTRRAPRRTNIGVFQSRTRGSREEKKNSDISINNSIVFNQTTAVVQPLNGNIVEGTSPTTHVGRRIKLKSLLVRWEGHVAPTTTGASPLRLLIVYDKQSNKLQTTALDVLFGDAITFPINLANNQRFVILMNEMIPCIGVNGPQAFMIERYRKLDLDVEFNEANGGTFADINTGLVTAFFWQDGGLLIANPFTSFFSRLRFVDA